MHRKDLEMFEAVELFRERVKEWLSMIRAEIITGSFFLHNLQRKRCGILVCLCKGIEK